MDAETAPLGVGQMAGRLFLCCGVHYTFSALADLKKTAFPGSRGNSKADSEWLEASWSLSHGKSCRGCPN